MLVKSNYTSLSIFIREHPLVFHVSIKIIIRNIRISYTFFPVKAMNAWGGGVGEELHSFLTSTIDEGESSSTSRSGRFTSGKQPL